MLGYAALTRPTRLTGKAIQCVLRGLAVGRVIVDVGLWGFLEVSYRPKAEIARFEKQTVGNVEAKKTSGPARLFLCRPARFQLHAQGTIESLASGHRFVVVCVSSFFENQSQSIFEHSVVKLFHINNILSKGV